MLLVPMSLDALAVSVEQPFAHKAHGPLSPTRDDRGATNRMASLRANAEIQFEFIEFFFSRCTQVSARDHIAHLSTTTIEILS